jgi:hypothetical protein
MDIEKPFLTGKYTIPPPQRQIEEGAPTAKIFDFDADEFSLYRNNYESVRREDLTKYYGATSEYVSVESMVTGFLVDQLAQEWPDVFTKETGPSNVTLMCPIANERLVFDASFHLKDSNHPYDSGLDAVASLIQEDVAIVRVDGQGANTIVAAHVTAPNYWRPADILDKNLAEIHAVVPGLPEIGEQWVARLVQQGNRTVQTQWGITTDNRLNHHPDKPKMFRDGEIEWQGRNFDPENPELYVRVERQTFVGFGHCFLFTIRTYFHDCHALSSEEKKFLAGAIRGMDENTRVYKGLDNEQNQLICDWLSPVGG